MAGALSFVIVAALAVVPVTPLVGPNPRVSLRGADDVQKDYFDIPFTNDALPTGGAEEERSVSLREAEGKGKQLHRGWKISREQLQQNLEKRLKKQQEKQKKNQEQGTGSTGPEKPISNQETIAASQGDSKSKRGTGRDIAKAAGKAGAKAAGKVVAGKINDRIQKGRRQADATPAVAADQAQPEQKTSYQDAFRKQAEEFRKQQEEQAEAIRNAFGSFFSGSGETIAASQGDSKSKRGTGSTIAKAIGKKVAGKINDRIQKGRRQADATPAVAADQAQPEQKTSYQDAFRKQAEEFRKQQEEQAEAIRNAFGSFFSGSGETIAASQGDSKSKRGTGSTIAKAIGKKVAGKINDRIQKGRRDADPAPAVAADQAQPEQKTSFQDAFRKQAEAARERIEKLQKQWQEEGQKRAEAIRKAFSSFFSGSGETIAASQGDSKSKRGTGSTIAKAIGKKVAGKINDRIQKGRRQADATAPAPGPAAGSQPQSPPSSGFPGFPGLQDAQQQAQNFQKLLTARAEALRKQFQDAFGTFFPFPGERRSVSLRAAGDTAAAPDAPAAPSSQAVNDKIQENQQKIKDQLEGARKRVEGAMQKVTDRVKNAQEQYKKRINDAQKQFQDQLQKFQKQATEAGGSFGNFFG